MIFCLIFWMICDDDHFFYDDAYSHVEYDVNVYVSVYHKYINSDLNGMVDCDV